MPITCRTLTEKDFFSDISLLAGANGLDRIISWPYIGQTDGIFKCLHGGELLFFSIAEYEKAGLVHLLKNCIAKKLSGIIILSDEKHSRQLPQELLQLANSAAFPVFMLYESNNLINITREITQLIVFDRISCEKLYCFFNELLGEPQESYSLPPTDAANKARQAKPVKSKSYGTHKSTGIYRLLRVQDPKDLEHYCQSRLQFLLDDKHATLLTTMKSYLETCNNTTKTALLLDIHRNTMFYRLQRIKELLQIDFEDPQQRLELQLALQIKDYLEEEYHTKISRQGV